MIDQDYIVACLAGLEVMINDRIDKLIRLRNQATKDKYIYRYILRKLECALGEIHKAQDKIDYKNINFKLDDTKQDV